MSLIDLSKLLREQRELKGLSLLEISASTRIKKEFLQKMEQGEIDFLPRMYVYSMFKKYAHALDIPLETVESVRSIIGVKADDELSTEINETFAASPPSLPLAPSEEISTPVVMNPLTSNQSLRTPTSSLPKTTDTLSDEGYSFFANIPLPRFAVAGIAFGVIAIIAILFFVFRSEKTPASTPQVVDNTQETSSSSMENENIDQVPIENAISNSSSPAPSPTIAKSNTPHSLTFSARNDSVWVRFVGDGIEEELILLPHSQKSYSFSQKASISVGRCQSVSVTLDGNPVSLSKSFGVLKDFDIPPTTTTNSP